MEREGESIMNATRVGIGLAKNVFSVHGVDAHDKVVMKKTISRGKLLECFANLPPTWLSGLPPRPCQDVGLLKWLFISLA